MRPYLAKSSNGNKLIIIEEDIIIPYSFMKADKDFKDQTNKICRQNKIPLELQKFVKNR